MTDTATIYQDATELSAVEKIRLVEMLLCDLDRPDQRVGKVWAAEAQRRWKAYRRGDLATLSHDEVMAKYRRPWTSTT